MALTLSTRAETDSAARQAVVSPRFQPHIQGLRAVAVAAVVLYHLWPQRLTGGFVGVDVFFVISGYLICGHLVQEIDATGTIRVVDFWARRIRRLLPASLLVLVVATVVVLLALPTVVWQQNLHEIRAAALYAENWQLVADSIDYLASANSPSLVQHFWSLSVEEQFYFLQPLLLLAVVATLRTRKAVLPVLIATVALSLPYSMYTTAAQPDAAYFSTGTRAWEFAVGGLAAVIGGRIMLRPAVRVVLAWVGLALVLFAVLVYTPATPFPGWTATVPVVGTAAALVFAGTASRFGPAALLGSRPMATIGDWSYSVYLWHWPLIVAIPFVLRHPAGWKIKLAILLLTLVLAALTKRFVEDRWRRPAAAKLPWRTFAAMAAAVFLVVAGTTGLSSWQSTRAAAEVVAAQAAIASAPEHCLGVDAVLNGCDRPFAVTATVVPAAAADDVPWNIGIAASRGCSGQSLTDAPEVHACVFNAPQRPTRTIALVGDSHADHLIDALGAYAGEHGWRFVTYTREGCSGIPSARLGDAGCRAWSSAVQQELRTESGIDAVLFSNYAGHAEWTAADEAAAFRALQSVGRVVVPIVDIPGMPAGVSAPSCIAEHLDEYDPCTSPLPAPGKTEAAAAAVGIPVVSINDLLCAGGRCHSVIGGEVVYMDEAHLTFHFGSSLREALGFRVEAVLAREG